MKKLSQFEMQIRALVALLALAMLMFSLSAQAAIPVMSYDYYASTELINPTTREVDLSTLSMLARISDPYRFNMTDYIPLKGLPESDSGDRAARRIFQHTVQNLLDRPNAQYAGVVASAQRINNNMNTSVGSTKNTVQFRVKPFETKAEIVYKGELPVESSLAYVADQNEMRFEISKKVSTTTLAYTHVNAIDQQKDLVGFRWNF